MVKRIEEENDVKRKAVTLLIVMIGIAAFILILISAILWYNYAFEYVVEEVGGEGSGGADTSLLTAIHFSFCNILSFFS